MINEKILALTWKQPFGTAMLYGKVETRTWETKYRGLVLISLSKRAYTPEIAITICGWGLFQKMCRAMKAGTSTLTFDGNAIAVGRLVDCYKMKPEDESRCFVKYREPWTEKRKNKRTGETKIVTMSLWCHVYEDVKAIAPFPFKGAQRWKKLDNATVDEIKFI